MRRFVAASAVAALCLLGALAAVAQNAPTTLAGKIVDFSDYMTHDHNMDAMKGSMMGHAMASPETMMGHAMASPGAMAPHAMATGNPCRILGILTASGKVYPLVTQEGSSMPATLCSRLNANVTLTGTVYTTASESVFLVSGVR